MQTIYEITEYSIDFWVGGQVKKLGLCFGSKDAAEKHIEHLPPLSRAQNGREYNVQEILVFDSHNEYVQYHSDIAIKARAVSKLDPEERRALGL